MAVTDAPRVAAVHLDTVTDWEDGVRRACAILVGLGTADDSYADACVASLHAGGPYIVLAKGLALAHARPEQGAKAVGLSLVRLEEPVAFGHPTNDPVDLVFAFSTPDDGGHLVLLRTLAVNLGKGLAASLRGADVSELDGLLAEAVADV